MLSPEQKQLPSDFVEESEGILAQATESLEKIELGEMGAEGLATFAGRIDGIMGCAKTMGLGSMDGIGQTMEIVSNLTEGCKMLGYKGAQIKNENATTIVAAFLADSVEILTAAMRDLKKGYVSVNMAQANQVKDRLVWLASQLKLSDAEQAALLARFGLK